MFAKTSYSPVKTSPKKKTSAVHQQDKRLLLATDAPFWRSTDGALNRINSLVSFFVSEGIEVKVFYLGAGFNRTDRAQMDATGVDILAAVDSSPPRGIIQNIFWVASWAINWITDSFRVVDPRSAEAHADVQPLTLADFRWPWAIEQFGEVVDRFQPNVVLIEYVKMAYLLDGISDELRPSVHAMIDTHDVLHSRAQQFNERGFAHWINISRAEEAEVLKMFDTILAIQPGEASVFREMAPDVRAIVVSHSLESVFSRVKQESPQTDSLPANEEDEAFVDDAEIVIGYFGSANYSNCSGMYRFLRLVWPELHAKHQHLRLVIGGSVCNCPTTDQMPEDPHPPGEIITLPGNQPSRIERLGFVDDVEDFYDRIDIAINPVEFGTGLKIKNCEALAFGKPLVTTIAGSEFMPDGIDDVVFTSDDIRSMQQPLDQLIGNPRQLPHLKANAARIARTLFSDKTAYRHLKEQLYAVFRSEL